VELIDAFKDRWDWYWLSDNAALPWSAELLEPFDDYWDWNWLFHNKVLPWSAKFPKKKKVARVKNLD